MFVWHVVLVNGIFSELSRSSAYGQHPGIPGARNKMLHVSRFLFFFYRSSTVAGPSVSRIPFPDVSH